jgi:hypothetical protein
MFPNLANRNELPAPTITRREELLYAHCGTFDAAGFPCDGLQQQEVRGIVETVAWSFASRGGGDEPGGPGNIFGPMTENTQEHLTFADEADAQCSHCGKRRELSRQVRPSYPMQIGGQDGLLRLRRAGIQFDPDRQKEIDAGAKESPLEALQRRYVNGEISDDEFQSKRAVLSEGLATVAATSPVDSPAMAAMQAELDAMRERDAAREEQIAKLLSALNGGADAAQPAAEPPADAGERVEQGNPAAEPQKAARTAGSPAGGTRSRKASR